MTKDLDYYAKKRKKYEAAIPKLRKMINESTSRINRWIFTAILYRQLFVEQYVIDKEVRKRDALLKQYGRIQGILQILDSQHPTFNMMWTIYNDAVPRFYYRECRI